MREYMWQVRGMDQKLVREFRVYALMHDKKVATILTELMKNYLAAEQAKNDRMELAKMAHDSAKEWAGY